MEISPRILIRPGVRRIQFRLRTLFLLISVVGVISCLLAYFQRRQRERDPFESSHAAWFVACMVTDHMTHNDGRWPSGWDDLLDDYHEHAARFGEPNWTMEELMELVEVDWNADPEKLLESAQGHVLHAPFEVIRLRDGGEILEIYDPNQEIFYFLQYEHPVTWIK
jgi:hypothetical protein